MPELSTAIELEKTKESVAADKEPHMEKLYEKLASIGSALQNAHVEYKGEILPNQQDMSYTRPALKQRGIEELLDHDISLIRKESLSLGSATGAVLAQEEVPEPRASSLISSKKQANSRFI